MITPPPFSCSTADAASPPPLDPSIQCTNGIRFDGGSVSFIGDAGSPITVQAIGCAVSGAGDPTQSVYAF